MNTISLDDWQLFLKLIEPAISEKSNVTEFKLKLEQFLEVLTVTNESINLTAITDFNSSVWKHLFDSLLITQLEPLGSVLDLGSGGGFPGIPLALFRKYISNDVSPVVLLDSIRKKTDCLKTFTNQLSFTGTCSVVNDRGENYLKYNRVDSVVMRAVAPPDRAIPWLTKRAPRWVLFVGPNNIEEWKDSEKKIFSKGFTISFIHSFSLPHNRGSRSMIELRARV